MDTANTGRMSPRKRSVLRSVIEAYVRSGEPIGSRLLSEELGVSSATIRNEMAALSEIGYLLQPHTSAGRVPSQQGYRLYVDQLMEEKTLTDEEKLHLDQMLMLDAYDTDRILDNAAKILSNLSHYVALSTTPARSDAVIRGVQFVQTGRRTAMAILMVSSSAMKSRVFRSDFDLTPEMMRIYFRVLNERLAGKELSMITPAYIQKLALSLGDLSILMTPALLAIHEMAEDAMQSEVRLCGEMNLLYDQDMDQVQLRRIVDFLESRQDLCRLLFTHLEGQAQARHVTVLIGQENNRPELINSSLLLARYDVGGQPAGVLGILGPTRMDYGRYMAHLNYLSASVGRILTDLIWEE